MAQDTAVPLPTPPPAGCDEAAAALSAYSRDAGTSRSGQAAAAQQAYHDLMGAGLNAQGAVAAKIRRLAAEFQELGFRCLGGAGFKPDEQIPHLSGSYRGRSDSSASTRLATTYP
ncbi:hypothetical protein ABZW11_24235 [Nonomuraea sp. NPDC004580]|uniref:hypothetical protein n=1 Tax=Nonomuraea sp. NPDC004580 TaxID=3154552 RepID=UPI0033A928CC